MIKKNILINQLFYIFLFFLVSCKSTDIIVSDNLEFDVINFNAVSKNIEFNDFENNQFNIIAKELIFDWYNTKIKTNGFEGLLEVNVTNLKTITENKDKYFKIEVYIAMNFKLENNTLESTKTFNISTSEFSEINGSFSILDQENLSANTIKKSLKKLSAELKSLI